MVLYDSFWRNGYFLLEHVFEKHQSLPKHCLQKQMYQLARFKSIQTINILDKPGVN